MRKPQRLVSKRLGRCGVQGPPCATSMDSFVHSARLQASSAAPVASSGLIEALRSHSNDTLTTSHSWFDDYARFIGELPRTSSSSLLGFQLCQSVRISVTAVWPDTRALAEALRDIGSPAATNGESNPSAIVRGALQHSLRHTPSGSDRERLLRSAFSSASPEAIRALCHAIADSAQLEESLLHCSSRSLRDAIVRFHLQSKRRGDSWSFEQFVEHPFDDAFVALSSKAVEMRCPEVLEELTGACSMLAPRTLASQVAAWEAAGLMTLGVASGCSRGLYDMRRRSGLLPPEAVECVATIATAIAAHPDCEEAPKAAAAKLLLHYDMHPRVLEMWGQEHHKAEPHCVAALAATGDAADAVRHLAALPVATREEPCAPPVHLAVTAVATALGGRPASDALLEEFGAVLLRLRIPVRGVIEAMLAGVIRTLQDAANTASIANKSLLCDSALGIMKFTSVWAPSAQLDLVIQLSTLLLTLGSNSSRVLEAAAANPNRAIIDQVVHRHLSGSMACEFWRCSACSRLCSDRYNTCMCGASRHSEHWQCGGCPHVNVPEATHCACCKSLKPARSLAVEGQGSLVVKPWVCSGCNTTNSAAHAVECPSCGANTGPLAQLIAPVSCTQCDTKNELGVALEPFCRGCGLLEPHVQPDVARLWRCRSCGGWHPWTVHRCPQCPEVHQGLADGWRAWGTRTCASCNAEVLNPLAEDCDACGVPLVSPGSSTVWVCTARNCLHQNAVSSKECERCGTVPTQRREEVAHPGHCNSCRKSIDPPVSSLLCPHCGSTDVKLHGGVSASVIAAVARDLLDPKFTDELQAASLFEKLLKAESGTSEEQSMWTQCAGIFGAAIARWQGHFDLLTLEGRRGVAVLRQLATRIGAPLEQPAGGDGEVTCSHCLGSHPDECCVFGTSSSWTCDCGHVNDVVDAVQRYVCGGCLSIRDCIMDLNWMDVWQCPHCKRANMGFEDMCQHCHSRREGEDGPESEPLKLPFAPAKCGVCGLPHLEALCPTCSEQPLPEVVDRGSGVVCTSGGHYALIQPCGTSRADQRVFVGRTFVKQLRLTTGQRVEFSAKLDSKGHRATMIMP